MAGISAEAAKDVVKPPPRPFLGGDTPKSAHITATAEARTGKLSNVREIAAGLPELTGNNSQRTENVRNNEAKYGPQLMEGLQGTLTTRFEQIGRLKNQDVKDNGATRKAYDLIREEARATHDPLFPIEETIFAMITDKDGKVDQQKLSDLLDDDRFKELSMRYLMIEKRKILEALGMRAIITPEGQRGNLHTLGRAIPMNIDRGNLNRLTTTIGNWLLDEGTTAGRDNGRPNWVTPVQIAGGTGHVALAAGTAAFFGSFTPLGPLVPAAMAGGLTALGEGAMALIGRSMQPGLQVTFEQNNEILNYAKNSATGPGTPQRDRLLYGVDPRDFVVQGNGLAIDEATVSTQDYGGRMHTTNLPGALHEALQILSMQAMWAEALNIDPKFVEDETQYLHVADPLDWRTASVPQTGERMLTDIHNAYIELVGGSGIPADYEARMNYLRQAESSVLEQRLHAILTDKSAEGESRRMDNLNSKLDSLNKDKPEYQARIQGQEKVKKRAEDDKTLAEKDKTTLTEYQKSVKAQRESSTISPLTYTDAGGTAKIITDPKEAIEAIEAVLRDPSLKIRGVLDKNGRTLGEIKSIEDLQKDAVTEQEGEYARAKALGNVPHPSGKGHIEDPQAAIIRANADNKLQRDTEKIQGIITTLNETKTKLQQALDAKTQQGENNTEAIKAGLETLEKFDTDYTAVIGFGITDVDLRTGDIGAILTRINGFNTAGVAGTWPTNQNNLDTRRAMVIRAIAEQQARDQLAANPDPVREGFLTRAKAVGITDHQLRSLSAAELSTLYTTMRDTPVTTRRNELIAASAQRRTAVAQDATAARREARAIARFGAGSPQAVEAAALAAAAATKLTAARAAETTALAALHTAETTAMATSMTMTEVEMAGAQQWAQEILNARVTASEKVIDTMETDIQNRQIQIEAPLDAIRDEVRAAIDVVSSWQNGKTHEHALTILTEEDRRRRLADITPIVPTDPEYTETERTSGKTIGELEFLQLMTGYRDNPTGREEAFRQVQNIFDSEENRRALVTALDPYIPLGTAGWPPAPAAPFGDILDIFSPFITDSTLSPDVMYRVTGVVVNRIYQNAMTL